MLNYVASVSINGAGKWVCLGLKSGSPIIQAAPQENGTEAQARFARKIRLELASLEIAVYI